MGPGEYAMSNLPAILPNRKIGKKKKSHCSPILGLVTCCIENLIVSFRVKSLLNGSPPVSLGLVGDKATPVRIIRN